MRLSWKKNTSDNNAREVVKNVEVATGNIGIEGSQSDDAKMSISLLGVPILVQIVLDQPIQSFYIGINYQVYSMHYYCKHLVLLSMLV